MLENVPFSKETTVTPETFIMRAVRHQIAAQFAKHGRFSRSLDRLNRLPLLRDYASQYPGIPEFQTREAMWDWLAGRYSGAAINYLEFGVHEGHSILHWARANPASASRFVGFDTFEGLPEHWKEAYPKGHFDIGGVAPRADDSRVRFKKGLFQDTMTEFLKGFHNALPLVVHIDCDLYSSTLYCLTRLDPILCPGTIVIFDEFGDVQHEFRAVNDYLGSYRRQAKLICSHDNLFTAALELQA